MLICMHSCIGEGTLVACHQTTNMVRMHMSDKDLVNLLGLIAGGF